MPSKFVDAAAAAKYVADNSGSPLERMLGQAVYVWLIESRSKPRGFSEAVDRRVQELKEQRAQGIEVLPFVHGARLVGRIEDEPFVPDETMSTEYIAVESLRAEFPHSTGVKWYADGADHEGFVTGYKWEPSVGIAYLKLMCTTHDTRWSRRASLVTKVPPKSEPALITFEWEQAENGNRKYVRITRVVRTASGNADGGTVLDRQRFATVYDVEKGKEMCKWLNINHQMIDLQDLG